MRINRILRGIVLALFIFGFYSSVYAVNTKNNSDEFEIYIATLTAYDNDVNISGLTLSRISEGGVIYQQTKFDSIIFSSDKKRGFLERLFLSREEAELIFDDLWQKNKESVLMEENKFELGNGRNIQTSLEGNIFLSRVGFNTEKDKALLYFHDGRYCLADRGYLVVLQKSEGKWQVKQFYLEWMS